jgi:hypothetical protein
MHSNHVGTVYCNICTLLIKPAIRNMNVKKEYNYIFVYIRVDVNKTSVLAASLSIGVLCVTLQLVKETETVPGVLVF